MLTDDIIKRKLLIEGDGGNDDRRINSLLKTFIKWCQSSESTDERFCFFYLTVGCSVVRYPRYLGKYRDTTCDDTSIAKVTVNRGPTIP